MSAATTQIRIGTGGSVTWANAETGAGFSREDSLAGVTPVPIPTTTGTNFSWIKNLVLYVTVAGTTTISNRRINLSGSMASGLAHYWQAIAVASYAQAATGNKPTDSGSNGAVPSGYTATTTSAAVYDATGVASSGTGPNGSLCVAVLAVDNSYGGGASTVTSLPNAVFSYDEA